MGKPQAELAAYDQLVAKFGDASEPQLRAQVARDMVNKAFGQFGVKLKFRRSSWISSLENRLSRLRVRVSKLQTEIIPFAPKLRTNFRVTFASVMTHHVKQDHETTGLRDDPAKDSRTTGLRRSSVFGSQTKVIQAYAKQTKPCIHPPHATIRLPHHRFPDPKPAKPRPNRTKPD